MFNSVPKLNACHRHLRVFLLLHTTSTIYLTRSASPRVRISNKKQVVHVVSTAPRLLKPDLLKTTSGLTSAPIMVVKWRMESVIVLNNALQTAYSTDPYGAHIWTD